MTAYEYLRAKLDEDGSYAKWCNREALAVLGHGPCPGGENECQEPDEAHGSHEDFCDKSHYPYPEWENKHDFDAGECWRCGGTQPGWQMREPTVTLPASAVEALVEILKNA